MKWEIPVCWVGEASTLSLEPLRNSVELHTASRGLCPASVNAAFKVDVEATSSPNNSSRPLLPNTFVTN